MIRLSPRLRRLTLNRRQRRTSNQEWDRVGLRCPHDDEPFPTMNDLDFHTHFVCRHRRWGRDDG